MMNQPPLDVLREFVDSRYTLVVCSAKRGRQILDGSKALINTNTEKPVTIALQELAQGKLRYERTKTGIK
jgi:DNA-directed RNA polymerase subunit omega